MLLSVIIPIYNVEKYLNQCVDSILSQDYSDYEIILVDDGSTDNSPKICDFYQEKNERIKVIHKPNGGLSSARNAGIKIAKGEYLMFIDSDDYISDKNAISLIEKRIIDYPATDVVMFSATLFYPNGEEQKDGFDYKIENLPGNTLSSLEYMISNDIIVGSACTKVLKKDFLIKNDLFFKEGIKSEDIEWLFRLSVLLPEYSFVNKHFYYYRKQREGSITNSVSYDHMLQHLNMIEDFCKDYEDNEAKKVFINYVAYQYSILQSNIINLKDKKMKKYLFSKSKKLSFLLGKNMHPKMKKVSLLNKYLGHYFTVRALGIYNRIRKWVAVF